MKSQLISSSARVRTRLKKIKILFIYIWLPRQPLRKPLKSNMMICYVILCYSFEQAIYLIKDSIHSFVTESKYIPQEVGRDMQSHDHLYCTYQPLIDVAFSRLSRLRG
jgi:hypothetical protein